MNKNLNTTNQTFSNNNYNLILDVDSYKNSHGRMLKDGVEYIQSSIVPRKSKDKIFTTYVIPFGINYILKEYLSKPISKENIDEAEQLFKLHGDSFDRKRWEYILEKYNGYLPLKINAVKEGQHIPMNMPLVRVENTDPKCAWLVSYVETILLRGIWYATTVATQQHGLKQILNEFKNKSWNEKASVDYHLHNFGARGGSSHESELISSMAHAINFSGSDGMLTNKAINYFYPIYNEKNERTLKGYVSSVIASEHSVSCSQANYENRDDFPIAVRMLDIAEEEINKKEKNGLLYNQDGSLNNTIISVVIDTYDAYRFTDKYIGVFLKDRIEKLAEKGLKLVLRPDSGDPTTMPITIIKSLMKSFGFSVNAKGYKALPPFLGVLQGDGIEADSIKEIIENLEKEKISLSNIVFGMGGKMVVPPKGRDTYSFAMKATAQKIKGSNEWQHLIKDPITDIGKKSHSGHISVFQSESGEMIVAEIERMEKSQDGYWKDVMLEVFNNGKIIEENLNSFEEVRKAANINL